MSFPSITKYIAVEGKLLEGKIIAQIKKEVAEKLGSDVDLSTFKLDNEFTLLIATLVLNLAKELGLTKQSNTDALIIEIISQIHALTATEKDMITKDLAFIKSKNLIKLIPFWKKWFNNTVSIILKKVL